MRNGILVPGTGIEPVCLAARDFKSLVSTNFTTRAKSKKIISQNLIQIKGSSGVGRIIFVV